MNRLQNLLDKYCPNGCEYRTLDKCCNVLDNQRKPITKAARVAGEYPYYGANGIQDYVEGYIFDGTFVLVGEDGSVQTADGRPVVTWAEGKIWVNNHAHIISEIEDVKLRYIFHYLQTMNISHLIHGNIPKLTGSDFKALEIPVPPLPVQEEIVRILDKFTELEAELEAELELRKKQYEYYRDKMLSLSDYDGEVEEIHLKDIGKVCMCKRIMKAQTNSDFENGVPFFKIGTFGKEPDCCISKDLFEDYKNRFSYPKKGNVLISAAGTIGRTVVFDGEPAYFQDSNIVWIDNDNSKVLDTYLNYVYQTSPWRVSDGGTISRLYNGNIEETKIVIPKDLDEQKRIVDILDKFSTLTSDISEGLPAEIKMRHQQYEYYRDKLLAFKRLECETA